MNAISRNEADRIAALVSFAVLDTPREPDFDDIASLASEICETPIAVVNLIEFDRQFFKAEVGLGVRETPLDSSFCAKAILEDDFLLVPDATKDPRFDCNPLVVGEPGLRFYAGALLKTAEGHAIGTLCVLDYRPRSLTELQQKSLRVLARQVMQQLELRRQLRLNREAQAEQQVRSREIAHRMKNTLALVQAIATQTFRGAAEPAAIEAFSDRLSALGRSHNLLLEAQWSEAPIQGVIADLLSVHDDSGRIAIDGPDITIGPRATVGLSMVLHELATNAAKYGALSNATGRVNLRWGIERRNDGQALQLTWTEVGGPAVREPELKGFGSRLIRMGLLGKGGAEVQYDPRGFAAKFEAMLSAVSE